MSNEIKEVCRWCGAIFCYCCPKCGKSVIEHADGCSLDPQHKELLIEGEKRRDNGGPFQDVTLGRSACDS